MKNKILQLSLLMLMLLATTSCTDANIAKLGGYGDEFKVQMINCDGTISHEWISSGKVQSEKGSDGYYFNDKSTKKLIEVTGRLIITKK